MGILMRLIQFSFTNIIGLIILVGTVIVLKVCIKNNKKAEVEITDLNKASRRLIRHIIINTIALIIFIILIISVILLYNKKYQFITDDWGYDYTDFKSFYKEIYNASTISDQLDIVISFAEEHRNKPELLPVVVLVNDYGAIYIGQEDRTRMRMNDILIQDIPEGIELIAVPENDKTSDQKKYIEKLKEINKVDFKDFEIHFNFGETGIDRKTKGVMTGIELVRTK